MSDVTGQRSAAGTEHVPDGPGADPLLEVRAVSRRFGGLMAVNEVSFEVRPGQIVSVIGPNGAGKSTLLNLLTGVTTLTAGSVHYRGKDISRLAAHKRAALGMSRTFQIASLIENESVLHNVMLGRFRHRRDGFLAAAFNPVAVARGERETIEAALDALRSLGLEHLANRPLGELPSGQARLVEVARSMLSEPDLLFLDEPAGGLIDAERAELSARLRELRGRGMAICLVEHNMDIVMGISDHIVVMNFGQTIAEGRPEDVRHNEAVIEAYLGRRRGDAA